MSVLNVFQSSAMTLDYFIQIILVPLFIFALVFYYYTQQREELTTTEHQSTNSGFKKFQRIYFLPYFLSLFSDWLQGPYVYKLYSYYGFVQGQIAVLYLIGFASSVVFGTCTGPIADKFGRKRMAVLFCIFYSLCCLTKLSSSFYVLLIGRVMGGISTSILFSVFESWYIHQHTVAYKYPIEWLSLTFSKTTFFNGFLAIGAGVLADVTADRLNYGPTSPFIVSIPFLLLSLFYIQTTWQENYGDQHSNFNKSCLEGLQTILKNPLILLLGLIQSIFESNMYIFVFLWTPVLEDLGKNVSLGLTFATFMICIMIGSSLFSFLHGNRVGMKTEVILFWVMGLSSISLFSCATLSNKGNNVHGNIMQESADNNNGLLQQQQAITNMNDNLQQETSTQFTAILTYLSFLLLEVCCGLYFPSIGTLRGTHIPEELRANITNWFRVPMNLITCLALIGMNQYGNNHGGNGESGSNNINCILFFLCGLSSVLGLILVKWFISLKQKKRNLEDEKKMEWKTEEQNEKLLMEKI